jgi:hypothetical protein
MEAIQKTMNKQLWRTAYSENYITIYIKIFFHKYLNYTTGYKRVLNGYNIYPLNRGGVGCQ